MTLNYDVIVAGAGPVGLFLACELRLAGASVLVLEQSAEPGSPLKQLPFGMRGLSAPTLEAFYRRGLLGRITAPLANRKPVGAHWMNQARKPGGHFAGIQFFIDKVEETKWPYRLPSPAGTSVAVEMGHLETVLAEHATSMGIEIKRGFGVEAFTQSDSGVSVRAKGQTFASQWLVGCDGGRSTVRKLGGFEFVGTDPEFTGYSVIVEMADADKLRIGRHYTSTGMYTYAEPGIIAMVNFDGGASHRAELTKENVQSVLRHVSETDVTVTALKLATTWTDRAFQTTSYRQGRVLLAGDAAHIHSPLGGQGLNLGIGDAMNLGWKLGAVVRGEATADLLDTYFDERQPVGAQVLDWSRAQVALMRPSRSSRALEAIIRDLIDTPDGATYFAERVWGVSIRYELGDSHPLVGRSVPDFELIDGRLVGELLDDGRWMLLDFNDDKSLASFVEQSGGSVSYLTSDVKNRMSLDAVLIRPDGIVAWVAAGAIDLDAITRMTGAPKSWQRR